MSQETLENYPTLYISGLPPTITETDLIRVLNDMKVESKVVIERDPVTSVPLGRIKIVFRYQPDTERFFATVNGSMFLGCKVHLTFKDPNMNFSNTSGSKSIVVKHMPLGVTSLEFYDAVRPYGRIISCKVMIDRSGNECYALLQFENQDAADKCMAEMNGSIFKGATIAMTWQFAKNSPYQYPTKGSTTTSSSGNGTGTPPSHTRSNSMSTSPSWNSGASSPSQWNTNAASWSQQPTPPTTPQWQQQNWQNSTGSPPNWQAQSPQNWQANPTQSPSSWNQGNPARRSWASHNATSPSWQQQQQSQQSWGSPVPGEEAQLDRKNLYIKNLEEHIDNLELFNMFRKYGRIVSARVMRDEATNKSKGFGFVSFETDEMAARAIADMNGRRYGAKALVVNIAEPRGFREKKLAVYHAGNN